MREPVMGEEVADEGGGSIASRALGAVFGGAATVGSAVPGLGWAWDKYISIGEIAAGTAVSELKARKDVFREEGLGSGTKESLLSLFGASDNIKGRTREILGIDEVDGIRDYFQKNREWQQNRDSAFWGEKLISEILFDPLSWVPPIGAYKLAARAAKAAGKAGTLAERGRAVRQALPTPPKPPPPPTKSVDLFNIPDADVIAAQGWNDTALRRITAKVLKSPIGRVPALRQVLNLVNPSGLLDKAKEGDQAAKHTVDYARTLELTENTINMDMMHLNHIGSGAFDTFVGADGNLFSKIKKEDGTFGDFQYNVPFERFDEDIAWVDPKDGVAFILSDGEKATITEARRLIEGGKAKALAEGVPLKEVSLEPGQHYMARFAIAKAEVDAARTAGGRVGAKPSSMKERLWVDIEDSVANDTRYMGAGSKNPAADIVHTYLAGIGKAIADKRYADAMKPFGTTFTERVMSNSAGRSVTEQVMVAHRRHKNMQTAVRNIQDAIHGKKMSVASVSAISRLDPTLGAKFDAASKLPKKADRIEAYKEVSKVAQSNREEALTHLKAVKDARRAAVAHLKNPMDLAPMPEPAFSGRLFSREVVERIAPFLSTPRDTLGTAGAKALEVATNISGVSRFAQLTFDVGAGFLQGAMVLTNSPASWAKGMFRSMHALADPSSRLKYLERDDIREVFSVFQGRLHIGSTEFTEALQPGAFAERVLSKVPVGGKAVTSIAQRFTNSYESFFDVARLEMARAFVPAIEAGRISADEVAQHINKMTGVMSSRALGVSATQRQVEAAAFALAPRYFRSTVALFADAFQGGWRGGQARKNLAVFFGGTALAYAGIAQALGQEIKLDPRPKYTADGKYVGGHGGQFMTVEIGGQHIGLGGKPHSIARALFRMASDPENDEIYAMDFLRSQSAPITSSLWDILSGETFLGEPVKTPGEIFSQSISGRLVPYYLEAQMNDDPRPSLKAGLVAELFGLRSYPEQPGEIRNELRDQLAAKISIEQLTPRQRAFMEEEGIDTPNWETLSTIQKKQLTKVDNNGEYIGGISGISSFDIKELTRWGDRVKEKRKGKVGSAAQNAFDDDKEDARTMWEIEAQKRQNGVDALEDTPRDFLRNMRGVNTVYGDWISRIHKEDGVHAEALAEIKTWQANDRFVPAADLAYDQYIQKIVANDDFVTEFGGYDFEAAAEAKRDLRSQWTDEIIDAIEDSLGKSRVMPPLWKRWTADRETIRPYWELTEAYLRLHPQLKTLAKALDEAEARVDLDMQERIKSHPSFRRMQSALRAQREQMRNRNPSLDVALIFWGYASSPQSSRARDMLRQAVRSKTY